MKKALIYLCVSTSLLLQSCLKDKLAHTYTMLLPVYKDKNEVLANIKSNPPREIHSPGKFFLYGNYIFLNEIDKGVHIIDNSDPEHPVKKAFIDIPGNLDIAVRGNMLYADLYGDLLVVDISNPLQAKFLRSLPGVFPERSYGMGFIADQTKVIVDWVRKDTTVAVSNSPNYILYANTPGISTAASQAAAPAVGVSGSLARFTIVNNYLYAVNSHMLHCISIADPATPVIANSIYAGWDIETVYPLRDKLFLGSMGGLFIFDISQPDAPVQQAAFAHARACDPVVADDNFAYVTLREGTSCGPTDNELQVINVGNLQSPWLVRSYPMVNPYGLAKDKDQVFVCDGLAGLKMFDASDPTNLVLKQHVLRIDPYDAIAWNGNLVVSANDGLYQYDYSDGNNLRLRSKLAVNR